MVVEVMLGTSDVHQGLGVEGTEVDTSSSAGSRRTGSAEDRFAEAVVQLIRKNGKVQRAIMDLVLSSPYVEWVL